jgi:uncharacterized protein (DUF849 family)
LVHLHARDPATGRPDQSPDLFKKFLPSIKSATDAISGAGSKISEWRFDWERPYLEGTKDFILSNTFAQMERGMRELGSQGMRFEFESYDIAHVYNLAHFADTKIIEPPFFIQGVFGILGGIGAEPPRA